MIELIGGPLDGEKFNCKITSDKPYTVIECRCGDKKLYCLYKLEDNKLKFIESKTYEQILKENEI